jgi:hypothetical protein
MNQLEAVRVQMPALENSTLMQTLRRSGLRAAPLTCVQACAGEVVNCVVISELWSCGGGFAAAITLARSIVTDLGILSCGK